jgi:hypothetical protein
VVITPPINGPAAAPIPPSPLITPNAHARLVMSLNHKGGEDVDRRDQQRRADALEHGVAEDQHSQIRRHRAEQRADPVERETPREALFPTPAVGQLAAGDHQDGHDQQEEGDRRLDALDGRVKIGADVVDHHVHVRAGEAADELGERERQDQPPRRRERTFWASHGRDATPVVTR